MADGVFKLKIELGKGMSTRADLIGALAEAQGGVDAGNMTGAVRDENDKTVGRWTIDGEIDESPKDTRR
jgi:hypothetical protein